MCLLLAFVFHEEILLGAHVLLLVVLLLVVHVLIVVVPLLVVHVLIVVASWGPRADRGGVPLVVHVLIVVVPPWWPTC